MVVNRSKRLRYDRSAHVLFHVLWLAPIVMPALVAAASAAMPRDTTVAPVQHVATLDENTRDTSVRARLRVTTMRDPVLPIPGSAGILATRLAGSPSAHKSNVPSRHRLNGQHVFRKVEVAENLRFNAGGMVVRLAGVVPVAGDATCKRLDGVVEPCSTRAMNRLDILTRGRAVTCDIKDDQADDSLLGFCRADKIDIAEDLVRNGLARRIGT